MISILFVLTNFSYLLLYSFLSAFVILTLRLILMRKIKYIIITHALLFTMLLVITGFFYLHLNIENNYLEQFKELAKQNDLQTIINNQNSHDSILVDFVQAHQNVERAEAYLDMLEERTKMIDYILLGYCFVLIYEMSLITYKMAMFLQDRYRKKHLHKVKKVKSNMAPGS